MFCRKVASSRASLRGPPQSSSLRRKVLTDLLMGQPRHSCASVHCGAVYSNGNHRPLSIVSPSLTHRPPYRGTPPLAEVRARRASREAGGTHRHKDGR